MQNWNSLLDFVKNFVSRYPFGPNAVQAGVVLFGNNGVLKIQFNSNTDLPSFIEAVDALIYRAQKTNIKDAIKVAEELGFISTNGDRRNGYDVAILVTDGEPQNVEFGAISKAEAESLKVNAGVEVFIIAHSFYRGQDSNSYADLQQIASTPLENHYYETGNFAQDLPSLIETIQGQISTSCQAVTSIAESATAIAKDGKLIFSL